MLPVTEYAVYVSAELVDWDELTSLLVGTTVLVYAVTEEEAAVRAAALLDVVGADESTPWMPVDGSERSLDSALVGRTGTEVVSLEVEEDGVFAVDEGAISSLWRLHGLVEEWVSFPDGAPTVAVVRPDLCSESIQEVHENCYRESVDMVRACMAMASGRPLPQVALQLGVSEDVLARAFSRRRSPWAGFLAASAAALSGAKVVDAHLAQELSSALAGQQPPGAA